MNIIWLLHCFYLSILIVYYNYIKIQLSFVYWPCILQPCQNLICCNRKGFYISQKAFYTGDYKDRFSIFQHGFLFFFCFNGFSRTASIMLNRNGGSEYILTLFLTLGESIGYLTIEYDISCTFFHRTRLSV